MGKVVHSSQITITREKGPTRKALIKGFGEPVYYGIHGGIKDFYKVDVITSYSIHYTKLYESILTQKNK